MWSNHREERHPGVAVAGQIGRGRIDPLAVELHGLRRWRGRSHKGLASDIPTPDRQQATAVCPKPKGWRLWQR